MIKNSTVKTTALIIAYFLLIFAAFYFCNKTNNVYSAVSLRYDEPVLQQQIINTLAYAQSDKTNLQISFWNEKKAELSAQNKTQNANCITYYGLASSCFYAEFIMGTYPGFGDVFGCAVSSELAWQLFKSEDILGQKVKMDNKNYIIRGVFKGKMPLALFSVDERAQFRCAEINGTTTDDAKGQTEAFLKVSGLPPPNNVLYANSISQIITSICFIPFLLVLLKVIFTSIKLISNLIKANNEIVFWCILICASAMLPLLLNATPAWLLPSQWSDFTHWSRITLQIKEHIWNYITLSPFTKDAFAKIYGGITCAFSITCISIAFKALSQLKRK